MSTRDILRRGWLTMTGGMNGQEEVGGAGVVIDADSSRPTIGARTRRSFASLEVILNREIRL